MNKGMADGMRGMFRAVVEREGSTIVVYKNCGKLGETSVELKGVKNNRKGRPHAVIFQFLDDPGVTRGDVIKLKAGSQLWRVTNKSETIVGDSILSHDVDVESTSSTAVTPAKAGHSIVVHGPVHGGIQIDSPNASQVNLVQTGISTTIRELKELFQGSSLTELDKEEATLALSRIGDLSAKSKSPELLAKVAEKIGYLKKIAADAGAIGTTALPLLEKLYHWISS